MTYGKSKERDMVRSILPSSSRKGARDNKRAINKARRTAVRQTLHSYRDALAHENDTCIVRDRHHAAVDLYEDTYDLCDGDWAYDAPHVKLHEADRRYDTQIKYAMWDRRGADKVAPFQRWAVAQTRDIRKLDRSTWLQSKMPNTLAVRHAMSHVEYLDEFYIDYGYGHHLRHRNAGAREWLRAARYAHALEMLYKIATGPLKRFNDLHTRMHYKTVYYSTNITPPEELVGGWKLVEWGDRRERARWNSNFIITRRWASYSFEVEPLMGIHDIHEYIARYKDNGYDAWGNFESKLAVVFMNYERLDDLPAPYRYYR